MGMGDGVVAPAPPRALTLTLSRCCWVFGGEGTDISRIDGVLPPLSFGHFPRERGKP